MRTNLFEIAEHLQVHIQEACSRLAAKLVLLRPTRTVERHLKVLSVTVFIIALKEGLLESSQNHLDLVLLMYREHSHKNF